MSDTSRVTWASVRERLGEIQSVAENTTRPLALSVVTVIRQQPGAGTFTYEG